MKMFLKNNIGSLVALMLLAAGFCSCDEIFELEETKAPSAVSIDRDELVLMVGDTCRLAAELTGSYTSPLIYWTSIDEDKAKVLSDGSVVALSPGDARIVVMSVSDTEVRDTAVAHIMDIPAVKETDFRYDMPVYAAVDGVNIEKNSSRRIMAYCGSELRGVSRILMVTDGNGQNHYCFLIRVMSNTQTGDVLSFRYYDSNLGSIIDLKETITFSHDSFAGYPSSPVPFTLKP